MDARQGKRGRRGQGLPEHSAPRAKHGAKAHSLQCGKHTAKKCPLQPVGKSNKVLCICVHCRSESAMHTVPIGLAAPEGTPPSGVGAPPSAELPGGYEFAGVARSPMFSAEIPHTQLHAILDVRGNTICMERCARSKGRGLFGAL